MNIVFFTIVLDGQPWLSHQWIMMSQLRCDWRWIVIEGVAEPVKDTGWCKRIPPRLSNDGTTEFLKELSQNHPNVTCVAAESWPGKTAMCNKALEYIDEPCLLWQLDADELWQPHQVMAMLMAFEKNPDRHWAKYWCRYMVGPNLWISTRNTYGNYGQFEWLRTWRYKPGMKFQSHEPPRLVEPAASSGRGFTNQETEALGCVFTHPAYALEKQLAFKEVYYGYAGAVANWRRLQQNMEFPCRLSEFFPWVTDGAMVERIA